MPHDVASAGANRTGLAAFPAVWSRLWFRDLPTTPIEITRIGVGTALLFYYGTLTPHLSALWGDDGWLPRSLIGAIRANPLEQSVFYHLTAPWQQALFHAAFVAASAALALGWRTSWVKWLVLIGHISYAYRNPGIAYGFHSITSALLVVLCFAPVGRALSLDRVRAVRRAKMADLAAHPPPLTSQWGFACTRLIQIQMAILFFVSAIQKLRGDDWWEGNAIWWVFIHTDYYNGLPLLSLLASHYWLVNVATYTTILIEVSYPFLIWQRETRPYLLAAAVFLHVMFAGLMGLWMFSFVMVMGHMCFLRHEWLSRLGAAWKRRIGPLEMIYDGRCGFCKRSMAWFLAFDGLGQVSVRNFRTDPSPVVSDDKMEKALYLVLPSGRALPGFEAYRYVVLRVPGLWWQIPFFYFPVVSRLLGHPIYDWIAANRSRMPF